MDGSFFISPMAARGKAQLAAYEHVIKNYKLKAKKVYLAPKNAIEYK